MDRLNSGIRIWYNFFTWAFFSIRIFSKSHLLIYVKSLPEDAHLLKRPRKSLELDFLSIQIRVSFAGVENPKIPGIQPRHGLLNPESCDNTI